ncbi:hypothetical protein [Pseudoneobacillus sp. C159]
MSFFAMQEQVIQHANSGFIPVIYEYSISSWRDSSRRERLHSRYHVSQKLLTGLLDAAKNSGDIEPHVNTEELATFLLSHINGLIFDTLNIGFNKEKVSKEMQFLLKLIKSNSY